MARHAPTDTAMEHHPFSIFAPYQDHLSIRFFTKSDQLSSDDDLIQALGNDQIVSLKQVHGNNIVIARSPSRREKEADGVITDQSDLWLSIRVADCQAFVIYAPDQQVVGVLHAGWKGLVNGVIPAFFRQMKDKWQVDASTVLVGAAPSLCMECAEFTDPQKELAGIDPLFFIGRHAALCSIANDQLIKCGILLKHIERHPDCTKCNPDMYWSYRGGNREAVMKGSTNALMCKLRQ